MNKYINSDKLIAEIEKRIKNYNASIEKNYSKEKSINTERDSWKWAECKWFLNLITSLQQEQQDCLMEEVQRYYSENFSYITSDQPTLSILTNIARHFAEWGATHLKK